MHDILPEVHLKRNGRLTVKYERILWMNKIERGFRKDRREWSQHFQIKLKVKDLDISNTCTFYSKSLIPAQSDPCAQNEGKPISLSFKGEGTWINNLLILTPFFNECTLHECRYGINLHAAICFTSKVDFRDLLKRIVSLQHRSPPVLVLSHPNQVRR